jgi:glycine hydroxymethyltransferase
MHIIAAKAVSFKEASTPKFKAYQNQIVKNASALATELISKGVKLFSNGTDNHLMLADLRGTGVTGKELEFMLDEVNITTNKNSIPFDTASPMNPNGIRLGTPSVTTRDMKEDEMKTIATLIATVLNEKEACFDSVKKEVKQLTEKYPLYKGLFQI